MKIVNSGDGQLANKIWSIVGVISHSLVFRERAIILNFGSYLKYFPNITKSKRIYFFPKYINQKRMMKLKAVFQNLKKIRIVKDYNEEQKTGGITFVEGWKVGKQLLNLMKKPEEIRGLFSPQKDIINKCSIKIEEERKNVDLIIGIHWRKGDYKLYLGGRYYYDSQVIQNYMNQLVKLNSDKIVKFFIATNEPVLDDDFKDVIFFINENAISMMEDLYSLSLCDYIIGPPSTFSMWASFYGKKPLRFLDFSNETIKMSDFDVIVAQDTFKNKGKWTHKIIADE